jgi:RNA polymerase-binding transcription factor DksA
MGERQLELAEELTRSIIESGVNKVRNRTLRPDNFEGLCECGAEIPPERVDAGYYNCVPCQEKIEFKSTGKAPRRL